MNFPNNNLNNYINNDFNNQNQYVNMNRRSSGVSDVNSFPDSANDKTMKIDDISLSKDGNKIDMNDFMNDLENKNTVNKISSSNDLAIIGECAEKHGNFKGIISKRINNLKMVAAFCTQNNLSSALNALNIMRDQTVTNDFFHYYINKNDMQKVSLTLDNVVTLLPHVKAQLNSKYDMHQVCALKSAKIILDCISERIISVKTIPIGSGVDLAREERVNKCNDIIALFDQIKDCPNFDKMKANTNEELKKLAFEFTDKLSFFLKTCNK